MHPGKLCKSVFFCLVFIGSLLFAQAGSTSSFSPPTLNDATDGLKIITQKTRDSGFPIDINKDERTGIEDVNYILQYLSGNREFNETLLQGVVVTGKISADVSKAPVPDVRVEVAADLNGNGTYENSEKFLSVSDGEGRFAVRVPSGFSTLPRLTLTTRAAGYSEFIKSYEDVGASFSEAITLAEGDFLEVDITGIASGPARGGRISLVTDQEVNIQLVRDRKTGRSTGRAGLGRFAAPPSGVEGEVLDITFPLRGLKLPAGAEKIYANVAYLDTVNNPEIMPGSFTAEGEGETPVDQLQTFAASMIKIYDENGNELMNDPHDYSSEIHIRIAIPSETYASLVDEVESTLDRVEVPLYYFDETEEIWKLHQDQNNAPVYGWLVDNFGNVLTSDDLKKLRTIRVDENGTYTGTDYRPAGVDSSLVSIFQVGIVNHFTNWNCDRAGRSSSHHFDLTDKYGNPINPKIRHRKVKGGWSEDSSAGRKGEKQRNIHTYADSQVDSLMKNFLSKDKAQRDYYLKWIIQNNNPDVIQALMEGLQRYAENERMAEQGEANELKAGLRRIFTNQLLTDAIINTNDLGGNNGIDCAKTPDLCKGVLAQAAEQVANSSDAKQAVAFLMQIAVDAYNPSKLDFEYALEKGIGMIELAVNRVSDSGEMGSKIKGLVDNVKDLKSKIESFYDANGNPPLTSSSNWKAYWEATWDLRNKISEIKSAATTLGSRLNRKALARTASDFTRENAGSSRDMVSLQREFLWDYEDIGGLFFGAHKFSQWSWGYYSGNDFYPTAPPANLEGGGEVGVLEYFNGSAWVPLPGRSSRGVDAGHIPVPNSRSYGAGSQSSPVAHLGTWVIDMQPNVQVSGRLVNTSEAPFPNATIVPVMVGDLVLYPDKTGDFSGKIALYTDFVSVQIPGSYWGNFPVTGNQVAVGDIKIPDKVIFNGTTPDTVESDKISSIAIDAKAFALSGSWVNYTFTLRKSYWSQTPDSTTTNTDGQLVLPAFGAIGTYYLDVTATAENDLGEGKKPQATKQFQIRILNQAPIIHAIDLSPVAPKVGDDVTITLNVEDPDSSPGTTDDIRSQYISCQCQDPNGSQIYLGTRQSYDNQGKLQWKVNTDNNTLYSLRAEEIPCILTATIYDTSWTSAKKELNFTLAQNHLPPQVDSNYLRNQYISTYSTSLYPSWVRFSDRNNDITSYELNTGKGEPAIISSSPITDMDPATPGIQGVVYDTPKMENGKVVPYRFSYKAIDQRGNETEVTASITVLGPLSMGVTFPNTLTITPPGGTRPYSAVNTTDFDMVELPSGEDRSFALGITASTPNPDENSENTLTRLSYTIKYEAANSYYWELLATGDAPRDANGKVTGPGSLDVEITKPGKYYVFVNATDSAGVASSSSKIFFVTGAFDLALKLNNGLPENTNPWYLTTDTLNFSATPADTPEGFVASYLWEVSSDGGNTFTWRGNGATLSTAFSAGSHIVRMTLKNSADSNQPAVVKTIPLTIYAPLALGLTPDSGNVNVAIGDTYGLTITNIPGGVTLKSAYWRVRKSDNSSADKMYRVLQGADTLKRSFAFTQAGDYIVSVTATDDRGLTSTTDSTIITAQDFPPQIDALTADTKTGAPPLTVTCTAAASDTNIGGSVVFYLWYVSGSYVENSVTVQVNKTVVQKLGTVDEPNIFRHEFTREGNYRITLIVEDNSGRKSPPKYVDIQVRYRPPVITGLSADPVSGAVPLSTTVTAVASALDNATLATYVWEVDKTIVPDNNSSTLTRTFSDPGTYAVKVTVTDSRGKSADKTLKVYALDPDQERTLSFRELWNRQLGNGYDFDQSTGDPYHHEGGGQFALVQMGDTTSPIDIPQLDANFDPTGNSSDPLPSQAILPGFTGVVKNQWGTLNAYLIDFKNQGLYDVGLRPNIGWEDKIRYTFPESYTCGRFFNAGYPQGFGPGQYPETLATPGQFDLNLNPWENPGHMNPDGQMNVLALLGTKTDTQCETIYYGFSSGNVWPIPDPQNPPAIAFTPDKAIATKTLVVPEGFAFNQAGFTRDGIQVWLSSRDLQTFANGNVTMPVVPNADYEFEFNEMSTSYLKTKTYTITHSAATMAEATLEPDLSMFKTKDIPISNLPSDAQTIVIRFVDPNQSVENRLTGLTPAQTLLSNVAYFDEATTVEIAVLGNWPDFRGFKKMPFASIANGIDFSTFTGVAAPTNLTITHNSDNKTLKVNFNSTAELCQVDVKVFFNEGRERTYHLITDGSSGTAGITLKYPIPDLPDLNSMEDPPPAVPGTDAIQSAQVTVSAIVPSYSYEGFVRSTLETFDLLQWNLYSDYTLLEIDALNPSQATWPLTD